MTDGTPDFIFIDICLCFVCFHFCAPVDFETWCSLWHDASSEKSVFGMYFLLFIPMQNFFILAFKNTLNLLPASYTIAFSNLVIKKFPSAEVLLSERHCFRVVSIESGAHSKTSFSSFHSLTWHLSIFFLFLSHDVSKINQIRVYENIYAPDEQKLQIFYESV